MWPNDYKGVFLASELARGVVQKPPPLFSGLILDQTITLIPASPYTGKSLLLMAMMVSLDTGMPLLGKFHPNGVRRVLAFMQDAPTWDYAEQLRKVARGYGLTREQMELLETKLVCNQGIDVVRPDFMDRLRAEHQAAPFDVVMFDALWRFHGMDENDNSQMGTVMGRFRQIQTELNVAVIVTTHTPKMRTGEAVEEVYSSRGATVIPASVDFQLNLRRTGARVSIVVPKGRGLGEGEFAYDVSDVKHPDGPGVKLEAVARKIGRREMVATFIAQQVRARSEVVSFVMALENGMSPEQASKAVDNDLRALAAAGVIEQEGRAKWRHKATPSA